MKILKMIFNSHYLPCLQHCGIILISFILLNESDTPKCNRVSLEIVNMKELWMVPEVP